MIRLQKVSDQALFPCDPDCLSGSRMYFSEAVLRKKTKGWKNEIQTERTESKSICRAAPFSCESSVDLGYLLQAEN